MVGTRWGSRIAAASLLVMAATGCAGTTGSQPAPAEFVDPVLGMLNKGIIQLDANIDRAAKRLDDLKQVPDTQDTLLQTLRAMDLQGLELHQQQWLVQRNHLSFAKVQLLAARQHPGDKGRLLQEWASHERQYRQKMEAFKQQRSDLEHERLEAEAQLIEQALR